MVKVAYRRIYAKLRHRTFYSLHGINEAIAPLLRDLNRTRVTNCDYSREERFFSKEKAELLPLPKDEYEMSSYAHPKVQPNGCVQITLNGKTYFFSVPYQYTGKKTLVRITRSQVRVYVDNQKVATHDRAAMTGDRYVTDPNHMASNNRVQLAKSRDYYVGRAKKRNKVFGQYMAQLFSPARTNKPPEMFYRTAEYMLKEACRYKDDALEKTCNDCEAYNIYTGDAFAYAIKTAAHRIAERACLESGCPTPTNNENLRGKEYYHANDTNDTNDTNESEEPNE